MGQRGAFTLIELLIVLGVITLLASLSFPAYGIIMEQNRLKSTRMIVDAVAQEATRTQRQYITVTVSGVPSLRRMWDVDADGLLDQDPTSASAASGLKAVAPADYRGFVVTTGINLPDLNIGTAKAVVDAWEQPLRIIYRQGAFGNSDFGIYSIGPDGVAAPDDAASDDICSWRK